MQRMKEIQAWAMRRSARDRLRRISSSPSPTTSATAKPPRVAMTVTLSPASISGRKERAKPKSNMGVTAGSAWPAPRRAPPAG